MKYFLHDSNAFNDEKITEIFIKFGYEGLGLFYTILEKLAQQEKPVKTDVLKRQLSVGKRLNKCWEFMEEIDIISSNNGETFNKQLLNYAGLYQIKKQKTAERVANFRAKQEEVTHYERVSNADKVKESKVNNTIVPNGTSIIINGTTYMEQELTYEPLEGKQTKSKYGRATMAILAKKYAELAGIELGKCFDASEWSKPLGSMYRYFDKDADKTMAYMEKAIKYFESKSLTFTPHTLAKDKEMMDKWTQGKGLDISERRKL